MVIGSDKQPSTAPHCPPLPQRSRPIFGEVMEGVGVNRHCKSQIIWKGVRGVRRREKRNFLFGKWSFCDWTVAWHFKR